MNRVVLLIFCFLSLFAYSQKESTSFQKDEFLKYRIHYGVLNAGFVTVELKSASDKPDSLLHTVGKGWTAGMVGFLFPVEDIYESYFDETTVKPVHFIRKIDEGGYTQNKEIHFDFDDHQAKVINHKKETEDSYSIENDVQDMLSSFYYIRKIDFSELKENDTIRINMFFDEKMNQIDLKILGRETIKTKFGKIKTIKVMPYVQEGRVFKDEENVIFWISDDENKIPVKIKASILVGSVKAELIEFNGLVHPFP